MPLAAFPKCVLNDLVARRTPGRALGVMAVHRFLYGVVFIAAMILMMAKTRVGMMLRASAENRS